MNLDRPILVTGAGGGIGSILVDDLLACGYTKVTYQCRTDSRGCFSIRNRGMEPESYLPDIMTLRLHDDPRDIPGILADINGMNPIERQAVIDAATDAINSSNIWVETAKKLIDQVE